MALDHAASGFRAGHLAKIQADVVLAPCVEREEGSEAERPAVHGCVVSEHRRGLGADRDAEDARPLFRGEMVALERPEGCRPEAR